MDKNFLAELNQLSEMCRAREDNKALTGSLLSNPTIQLIIAAVSFADQIEDQEEAVDLDPERCPGCFRIPLKWLNMNNKSENEAITQAISQLYLLEPRLDENIPLEAYERARVLLQEHSPVSTLHLPAVARQRANKLPPSLPKC